MFSFLMLPVLIRKLNYCNLHLFEHSINANIVHINLYSYSYIFRNNHPLRNIHRSCYSTFSDDPNQCPGSETAPQQQQSPLLIQHLPLFHLRRRAPRRCIRAMASCRKTAPSPPRWRTRAWSSSARRLPPSRRWGTRSPRRSWRRKRASAPFRATWA